MVSYNELRIKLIDGKNKTILRGVPLKNPLNVESLSYFPEVKKVIDNFTPV